MSVIKIGTRGLTLPDCQAVLSGRAARLELAVAARRAVRRSRKVVDRVLAEGRVAYGLNTGVGRLSGVRLEPADLAAFQGNVVRSHAAGVGPAMPEAEVRLALALRIATLAQGYSGVSEGSLDALIALYNAGIAPVVPEQGSVGASGDLAPLAHIALALLGEGEVFVDGRRIRAARALAKAGLAPRELEPKDALTLINGTQPTLAKGVRLILDAANACKVADIATACVVEAQQDTDRAYLPEIQALRPHPGQADAAANLRRMLEGSEILPSHRACSKVQDAYSVRCAPQVHGAVRDALAYARQVIERELRAVTDNPLVFHETGEILSCGNFHGQPLSNALDTAAAALATLGGISERRIEQIINPDLSGLPAFLAHGEGLRSGFMMAQVTAASLASESKGLAHPAGVDSISTSAAREDYVSMCLTAARRARMVLTNVEGILAIELLCACQGLEFLRPLKAGRGVEAAYRRVREAVGPYEDDRPLSGDLEKAAALVRSGAVVAAAETAIGSMK